MSIGCRIAEHIKRCDKRLINLFKDIKVTIIDDSMTKFAALDQSIRPLNRTPLLGNAFTVKVAGDNLMLHKALEMAEPGDVMIVAASGIKNRAIFGEIMSTYCRKRGIAGLVTDGIVRDSDSLESYTDFSVYATGICANGPYKSDLGEIGYPVTIGGRLVRPGDIIVGDCDGVIAIPPEDAENIYQSAIHVMEWEQKIKDELENGNYILKPVIDERLKALGVEIK